MPEKGLGLDPSVHRIRIRVRTIMSRRSFLRNIASKRKIRVSLGAVSIIAIVDIATIIL